MLLEDGVFLPLEGVGVPVIGGEEVVDVLPQVPGAGKAGRGERLAAKNAEPDLDLIEPGRVRRDVMEVNVLVSLQPAVVFRLMRVEVIQHDVNLPASIAGHDAIQEVEEFHAAATPVVARLDQPGGHFQGGK